MLALERKRLIFGTLFKIRCVVVAELSGILGVA